mmetsp:Transcript_12324/g.29333  ORF Transcript_12324/g.29333 Transcript_12324/m.29333 type:complete len:217 (+) Transcript_12324:488-1138(+)
MSVIRWTKKVKCASCEFLWIIRDSVNSLCNIDNPHWLGEGLSLLGDRNHSVHLGHVGKEVKELIFCSKELCGTNNGGPWVNLADGLFSRVFGSDPFRWVIGVETGSGNMNQVIHLHFHTKFGNLTSDSNIDIFKRIVLLHSNIWETGCLDGLMGFIMLGNHVDDDIGITNHVSHGIDIASTVKAETSVSQIKHGLDITVLGFVASVSNVCICPIFA